MNTKRVLCLGMAPQAAMTRLKKCKKLRTTFRLDSEISGRQGEVWSLLKSRLRLRSPRRLIRMAGTSSNLKGNLKPHQSLQVSHQMKKLSLKLLLNHPGVNHKGLQRQRLLQLPIKLITITFWIRQSHRTSKIIISQLSPRFNHLSPGNGLVLPPPLQQIKIKSLPMMTWSEKLQSFRMKLNGSSRHSKGFSHKWWPTSSCYKRRVMSRSGFKWDWSKWRSTWKEWIWLVILVISSTHSY